MAMVLVLLAVSLRSRDVILPLELPPHGPFGSPLALKE